MKKIIKNIKKLDKELSNRNNIINMEGIWLFLATLGCWSVNNKYMQLTSLFIVLIIFIFNILQKKKALPSPSPMVTLEKLKSDVIESDFKEKEEQLNKLDKMKKNFLSYKSTPIFLICYTYWGLSLFIFFKRFTL